MRPCSCSLVVAGFDDIKGGSAWLAWTCFSQAAMDSVPEPFLGSGIGLKIDVGGGNRIIDVAMLMDRLFLSLKCEQCQGKKILAHRIKGLLDVNTIHQSAQAEVGESFDIQYRWAADTMDNVRQYPATNGMIKHPAIVTRVRTTFQGVGTQPHDNFLRRPPRSFLHICRPLATHCSV